jgi:hypothetical protein
MRPLSSASLLLAVLALALAACAGGAGNAASQDDARPTRSAPALETVPPTDEPVIGEVPAELLASIVADAAERTGVDPDAVDVISAEAVTWNDGSLGCPEPGASYTMALVDGYHLILRVADEELDYRTSANGGFRLCENGGRPGG